MIQSTPADGEQDVTVLPTYGQVDGASLVGTSLVGEPVVGLGVARIMETVMVVVVVVMEPNLGDVVEGATGKRLRGSSAKANQRPPSVCPRADVASASEANW